MSNNRVEKSEMSAVDFCQSALQERIAPPSIGNIKQRLLKAARATGWSYNRVRDVWYADPRISIKAEELVQIERLSKLEYARKEARDYEEIMARAEALLDGQHADFFGPFVDAMRSALRMGRVQNRS